MRKTSYREVFIFISGSTPQVVTETIYALAVKKPPVYPNEIFIITTCSGKALAEKALFELMIYTDFLRQKINNCKYPDSPTALTALSISSPLLTFQAGLLWRRWQKTTGGFTENNHLRKKNS